jgi:peptidoglycan/LPS O-acetylase OafA/YrhL
VEYPAIHAGLFIPLGLMVISCAYSVRRLSSRLIKGHDISYGIYIYHMVIINVFIELNWTGSLLFMGFAVVSTLAAANLSWMLVEKPMLGLKKHALRPVKRKSLLSFARLNSSS